MVLFVTGDMLTRKNITSLVYTFKRLLLVNTSMDTLQIGLVVPSVHIVCKTLTKLNMLGLHSFFLGTKKIHPDSIYSSFLWLINIRFEQA